MNASVNDKSAHSLARDPPPLTASAVERIEYIKTNLWAPYSEATQALRTMQRLLSEPDQLRPENLAVIGEPNFGKSAILERFLKLNPQPYDPEQDEVSLPILMIELVTNSSDVALMRELICGIGATCNSREPVDQLVRRFVVLVKAMGVKLIIIDEFHNGLAGNISKQREFLNLIRKISNRTKRPMIAAGTEEVENFILNDRQLDERFTRLRLPRWNADINGRRLLKGFESRLGLGNPSNLDSAPMLEAIMDLTKGSLGNISRLLVHAAEAAIKDGSEVLTIDLLKATRERLPGRRLDPT